jgi:hypothetical protein
LLRVAQVLRSPWVRQGLEGRVAVRPRERPDGTPAKPGPGALSAGEAPKFWLNSGMEILQIYKKIYEILSICGTLLLYDIVFEVNSDQKRFPDSSFL